MPRSQDKTAVLRGALDVLVLQAVSDRPRHGFEISLWIEEGSRGALDVDDSALYQSLHRLEARGLIRGAWGVSDNNRRARYYKLTPTGRTRLAAERSKLVSFAKTIATLLDPARGR